MDIVEFDIICDFLNEQGAKFDEQKLYDELSARFNFK